MNENSKLPSWLKDKKKLIIICIIIFAMILTSFNMVMGIGVSVMKNAAVKGSLSTSNLAGITKLFHVSHHLNGLYMNRYVNETMEFGKDGSLVYGFNGSVIFGSYEIHGSTLIINLDGTDFEFNILNMDNGQLDIELDGFVYNYVKQ